jgi:hypothetical protein
MFGVNRRRMLWFSILSEAMMSYLQAQEALHGINP